MKHMLQMFPHRMTVLKNLFYLNDLNYSIFEKTMTFNCYLNGNFLEF